MDTELLKVDNWMEYFSKNGVILPFSSRILRVALIHLGANPNPGRDALSSLESVSSFGMRRGMVAVWGEKFPAFESWTATHISAYEAAHFALPVYVHTGRKDHGMKEFFGLLTSFAYDRRSFGPFMHILERAWHDGSQWEQSGGGVGLSISTVRMSFFPPGYPLAAWNFMRQGFSG